MSRHAVSVLRHMRRATLAAMLDGKSSWSLTISGRHVVRSAARLSTCRMPEIMSRSKTLSLPGCRAEDELDRQSRLI